MSGATKRYETGAGDMVLVLYCTWLCKKINSFPKKLSIVLSC